MVVEEPSPKAKKIGCLVVIGLVFIGTSCLGIVGTCEERSADEDQVKRMEKIIQETDFTDRTLDYQNRLFAKCLTGELAMGRVSEEDVKELRKRLRDKSDIELWKTTRLILALQCINTGYTVEIRP